MSHDIVIVAAGRTAVGSFNGAFANTPAHELGAEVIKGILARAGLEGGDVDEVILGQVLTAGQGQNPARQAAMKAGVPDSKTAWSLNQVCGSGLRAVALGQQQIANGDAAIIVAGGQENMSLSPHASHMRAGTKMGDIKLVDTMIKDGLIDAFQGYHMGTTAENIAPPAGRSRARTRTSSRSARRTRRRRRPRPASSRTRSSPSRFPARRAISSSTRMNTSGTVR